MAEVHADAKADGRRVSKVMRPRATFILAMIPLLLGAAPARVEFNRDVRPILAATCFRCHGFDKNARKADFRLDDRDEATRPRKAGTPIVPGDANRSEIWRRINSNDPDEQMPPAKSNLVLTDAQKATLKAWIEQGAEYQPHWAFIAPKRPDVPKEPDAKSEVDAFVLSYLRQHNLRASPEADRATLIRRLSFDLTGLPPTLTETDQFLSDVSANAYERLVDRLLASPHFGERMAIDWLDAARFADTHGYQRDAGRDMTAYREWVIDAFNRNVPFDLFTVDQLAGDMLPNAALEEKIASGFNRNHRINIETGSVPEEFHAAYVIDRVNTTGTVWLGLTVGCAQCHDHKYDPLTQAEFYRLYAIFNNVPDNGIDGGTGNAVPLIKAPTPEQRQKLEAMEKPIESAKWNVASAIPPDLFARTLEAASLLKQRADFDAQVRTTMVMQEMPMLRETRVLLRGQYDQLGPVVAPGVPAFLPALPVGAKADRLGLARWVVSGENPLTSRVIVNRIWQSFFGVGIVKTSEDFGTQGELPSHPELLDWLAVDFRESGWDVKRLVKKVVMSATYRQSSVTSPKSLAGDPEDRFLSHFPRRRLQSEFIRDQALAVSGLLDGRIGGASVSPYQPANLWEEMTLRGDSASLTAQTYVQSHGRDLYRRTMYTFWKRTIPPPALSAFDAPDRETCVVRRQTTNTPLQALVLWNDPTYVEAYRRLAERVMREANSTPQRIDLVFRLAAGRLPNAEESSRLQKACDDQLKLYESNPAQAETLLHVGESERDAKLPAPQLATWTVVAGIVLNLDESISKN
jgi:hypothetical protein